MNKRFISSLIFTILFACNHNQIEQAKNHSDRLMESLSDKSSLEIYPPEYFERSQMEQIVKAMGENCDYENRKGKYVDHFYKKELNGTSSVSFIYEYFLKCDSIRFVLTYKLEETPVLFQLQMEPIEKENPMIVDGSKQLVPH